MQVYHYTDFQALDGIIRQKELRVNNVLNMNDTQEMRLFMRGLSQAIVERILGDGQLELSQKITKWFKQELAREFTFSTYAACFSLFRDDAAQWDRYGNNGRGICIGFDLDKLTALATGPLSVKEVFYQIDMQDHELVSEFYARIMQDTSIEREGMEDLFQKAWIASAAFKHPSFSSEKEIRLMLCPSNGSVFGVKPEYHVSRERIKKYYPLDLQYLCEQADVTMTDLIQELIIGPESTQSAPILQDYLIDQGMSELADRVSLSGCPLRKTLP